MTRIRKIIRTIWISFGTLFLIWMANSFRAQGFDQSILKSDSTITIEETSRYISFRPNEEQRATGLIFFPGGMVQPEAYAPLATAVARQGHTVFIVKLPFGSAPLESQQNSVMQQSLEIMQADASIPFWVVGGHSRGAAIASRFALSHSDSFDGLLLIGTSHPKEAAFDLSNSTLAVTKIYASNDGLASPEEVETNTIYLPEDTTWVRIDGGNHSQFAYVGKLLRDNAATISRERQQELMVNAILESLNSIQGE